MNWLVSPVTQFLPIPGVAFVVRIWAAAANPPSTPRLSATVGAQQDDQQAVFSAIDSSAPIGEFNSGQFLILFELFSGDPLNCGQCFVDSGGDVRTFVPFPLQPGPEPGTNAMIGVGLSLGYWLVRSRRAESI